MVSASDVYKSSDTVTYLWVPPILPLCHDDADRLSGLGRRALDLGCILELELLGRRLGRGD